MIKLNRYLQKRLRSDRGDAVLVGSLLMIPLLGIALGICMQVSASNTIRTERINAIQDSTAAAVKLTNSQGSLSWDVVDRVVNEYENNRFGKRVFSATANNQLQAADKGLDTAESKNLDDTTDPSKGCLVDKDGAKYPQYKVTLDTVRGQQADSTGKTLNHPRTVSFTRTQPGIAQLNSSAPLTGSTNIDPVTKKPYIYRSVTVEIIDQAPNLYTGFLGIPCQKFDLTASSVTFSANNDTAGNGAVG